MKVYILLCLDEDFYIGVYEDYKEALDLQKYHKNYCPHHQTKIIETYLIYKRSS